MTIKQLPGLRRFVGNNGIAYMVIVAVIFGIGTVGSVINWRNTVDRANNSLVNSYHRELNQSKSIITQSLNQYSLLLDDGTSLLTVDGATITQDQWLAFFQSYGLTRNYPGVDDVNYSSYVPAADLSDFISTMAAQGQPNFTITPTPDGTHAAYVPVTYVGYIAPSSEQAIGFDQLSDPVRGAAVQRAVQTGAVTMSGKITSKIDPSKTAFLIFRPIYGGPANTVSQRQASIRGFVFMAVNSNTFFNTLLSHYVSTGTMAVQIYDSSISSNNLLYQTKNFSGAVKKIADPIPSTLTVTFGGHTWDFKIIIARSVLKPDSGQATTDLVLGIVISTIAAALLWYFTYYRERKIYWQKQNELQLAKDELLSLASHQLRTPATIVKQYLGLLLQNYAGDITTQQRHIVQTAYNSNERQLEIANQFLEAARLGSGRIELHTAPVELNDILTAVINDQRKIARDRRQKIIFTGPQRVFRVDGDPKYLPMIFENLLSNASKYSRRGSAITVSLRKAGNHAVVTVSDQGIGIAAKELPTLFEKFSHASNEHSASGNSTGIGLYLAQQVAQLHGGGISVESALGKGSRFTVRIPLTT